MLLGVLFGVPCGQATAGAARPAQGATDREGGGLAEGKERFRVG